MIRYFFLIFLFVSCVSNDSQKDCVDSFKKIKGELRTTSFQYEKKFINIDSLGKGILSNLKSKYNCLNELQPSYYVQINNKNIFVFHDKINNKGIILLNENLSCKFIRFSDDSMYYFKGVSYNNKKVKIFLIHNKSKEVIVINENMK